jgi:hypothetical protein
MKRVEMALSQKISALEERFRGVPLKQLFDAARVRPESILSRIMGSAAQSSTTASGVTAFPPPRPLTNTDIVLAKIIKGELTISAGKSLPQVKAALNTLDAKLDPKKMEAALIETGFLKSEQKPKLVPPAPKRSLRLAFAPS